MQQKRNKWEGEAQNFQFNFYAPTLARKQCLNAPREKK